MVMLKKLILILLALALVVSPLTAVAGGIYRHAEGDERHGVGGKGDPGGGMQSPTITTQFSIVNELPLALYMNYPSNIVHINHYIIVFISDHIFILLPTGEQHAW